MQKMKSEEGMVMIEAIYVVVIAVMIIFFTINIGVIYHNRIVVASAANEAAAGVAANYGSPGKEPFFSYTGEASFYESNPYRYWLGGDNGLDRVAEKKAKWYAGYLISEMEFAADDIDYSGIKVECKPNGIGLKSINVSVTRTYDVFVLNPFLFFGLEPEYQVKAEGTAVCYDVIHEMNSIALQDEIENKLAGFSPTLTVAESIIDILEKLMRLW